MDIINTLEKIMNENMVQLVLYILVMMISGTILYRLVNFIKLPEIIGTPIAGMGALFISFKLFMLTNGY
ncbi:hypothetical protein ACFSO7_11900 [Bacillus sp. CGMCC 1.16607]|uniref:hypothetical protein n=1 Tax=Bacillus sp. CGMCC 1.16607 TaxID=3351842 RepID=UPI00363A3544